VSRFVTTHRLTRDLLALVRLADVAFSRGLRRQRSRSVRKYLAVLTQKEWNLLVDLIHSGELKKI